MNNTIFLNDIQLRQSLADSIDNLETILEKTNFALSETKQVMSKDSYHFLTRTLKPRNKLDKMFYSHIANTVYQAEIMAAGGGFLAMKTAIKTIRYMLQHEEQLTKNQHKQTAENIKELQEVLKFLSTNSEPAYEALVKEKVKTICGEKLGGVVWNAIELAGTVGNIVVDNNKQQTNYIVELKYGYRFPVTVMQMFLSALGTWECYNAKILCVDGIIDKVSELDKILLRSTETKIPLVIVAQGYNEEVVATIKTNNNRGVFNIIPLKMEPNVDNINIMNDIATVSGCDVVSTLKGDMLLYTDYDALPLVDFVRCTEGELTIENTKTRNSVLNQIKFLLDKRNDQQVFAGVDMGDFYTNRVKNLLSTLVTIQLPNMSFGELETTKTKIDIALRTARTLISHGYLPKEELERNLTNEYQDSLVWNVFRGVLMSISEPQIPTIGLAVALWLSIQKMVLIMRSAGMVVEV